MKRTLSILLVMATIMAMPTMLTSCGDVNKDEPYNPSSTATSKEISPQVKIITAVATHDDFTVAFRVKSVEKPVVTLSWSSHNGKTSNPSLNKHSNVSKTYEEVKQSGYTWWFYQVTHSGFHPGDYVYYQVSADNAKGSDESPVGHVIIKR